MTGMSMINLGFISDMPAVCLRYRCGMAEKMSTLEIYLKNAWGVSEIYLRNDIATPEKMSEIYLRNACDISQICLKYVWGIYEIFFIYVWHYMSEICLR